MLAKGVKADPSLLGRTVKTMQRNVQSICNTFHVPVKDVGNIAARVPRLLTLTEQRFESSAAALI